MAYRCLPAGIARVVVILGLGRINDEFHYRRVCHFAIIVSSGSFGCTSEQRQRRVGYRQRGISAQRASRHEEDGLNHIEVVCAVERSRLFGGSGVRYSVHCWTGCVECCFRSAHVLAGCHVWLPPSGRIHCTVVLVMPPVTNVNHVDNRSTCRIIQNGILHIGSLC